MALLVAAVQRDGRYWRMIGRSAGIPGTGVIDPIVWSGRAVQGGFVDLLDVRSCINVSGFRLERGELLAIMDISARAISLPDRPRTGRLGHQCSHAPGRPILHLFVSLSQTLAGKWT